MLTVIKSYYKQLSDQTRNHKSSSNPPPKILPPPPLPSMHLLRHLLQFSGDSVDVDDDQSVDWSEPTFTEFSVNVKNSTFTEASLFSPQIDQRNSSASTLLTSAVETAETKVVTPFKDATEGKSEISGGNEAITDKTSIIISAESKFTADEHPPVNASLDGWRSDRITIEVTTVDQAVKPLTRPTTTMEIQIEPTNTFLQLSPSMPATTVELENLIDSKENQVSNTQAQSFMTTLVITPVTVDVPQVISVPAQVTTTSNNFVPTTASLPIYLTQPLKAPPAELITTTNETLVAPLKPPTLYTATLARDLEAMKQVLTVAMDPGFLSDDDFNHWPTTPGTTLGTKLGATLGTNLSNTLGEYRTRFYQQTVDLLDIISYPLKIITDSIKSSVEVISTFGTTKETSFLSRSATFTTSQTKLDSRTVTGPETVITKKVEPLTALSRSLSTLSWSATSLVTPSRLSSQTTKSKI